MTSIFTIPRSHLRPRLRSIVGVAMIALLAACGGGGSGSAPEAEAGAPGGQDAAAPPEAASGRNCRNDFSAARVERGEDCAPQYFAECPESEPDQAGFGFTSVPSCNGVDIEVVSKQGVENSFSGGLDYVVLKPSDRSPTSVLVSLHFRQLGRDPQTAIATYAALMRMSELVKARNVMIVLPGSPSGNWPQSTATDNANDLLAGLPLNDALTQLGLIEDEQELLAAAEAAGLPASGFDDLLSSLTSESLSGLVDNLSLDFASVEDNLDYIELAMFDAFSEFGGEALPRYVAGLSNGGIYAGRFACRRPELFRAAMIVAGSIGPAESEACKGNSAIGTVQVHGTVDALAPYGGGLTFPVRGGQGPDVLGGLLSPGSLDLLGLGVPTSLEPSQFEDARAADIAASYRSEENQSLIDQLFALSSLVPVLGSNEGLFLDVFGPNNGCSGPLDSVVVSRNTVDGDSAGDVIIEQFPSCENEGGYSSILVTVTDGGHHWPGYDDQSDLDFNAFGPISRDFDATIQGFDLLQRAGGLR